MTKTVSPDDRQKLDPIFMQVVQSVQAEAQQTAPQGSGAIATMFHKEQVGDALQGCAMLIAGWNENRVDEAGIKKAATALRGLGLPEIAERVENLVKIDEA